MLANISKLSTPKKVLPCVVLITNMRNLVLLLVLSIFEAINCNVEITVLHTNDIHSHFEEMTARSGEKYGGKARRKTMVRFSYIYDKYHFGGKK